MVIDLKTAPTYIGRSELAELYLGDIKNFEVIDVENERILFKRIHMGDMTARNQIIESNQRFVYAVAKRYATNETNLLDIINEGNIGLIKAIDSFDYLKGYKFITHAVWYIRREINAFLINNDNIIRKSNYSKTFKRVNSVKNRFFLKNGYYPSPEEIVTILKNDYDCNISDKRDVYDMTIDSIDIESTYGETTYENPLFNGKSASFNNSIENENIEFNKYMVIHLLKDLSEREQNVIKLVFGIDVDRCYEIQEVAEKLELTPERVRQIKHRAVEKLRKNYECFLMVG